jgi:biuret amidohydrolase
VPKPLAELVAPEHTAVLTMELQRGIVGDLATMTALGDELASSGGLAGAAAVCKGARAAGAKVVHCLALYRPDRLGSKQNCRILSIGARGADLLVPGHPGAELLPELERQDTDFEVGRYHGLTPWMGTELDALLRNMGVTTVVATGVSVNIGVFGMVLGAVDLGYDVVLARDAVAGVPHEYAESQIDGTLSLLATVVTSADLLAAWSAPS